MTTAVTTAPSKLSNVMVVSSQASAGVQIERRDGKGRHANSDEDKIESEAEHCPFLSQIPGEPIPALPENAFGRFEYRECRI